jgi:hypothetical protein
MKCKIGQLVKYGPAFLCRCVNPTNASGLRGRVLSVDSERGIARIDWNTGCITKAAIEDLEPT